MASPFLYFADDRLSLAELSAARLDGDLVELGDALHPRRRRRDAGAARRVADGAARRHARRDAPQAAWVHGALPEPPAQHTYSAP